MLRFDDLIGDEVGQIPLGAKIERANLKLTLIDDIDSLLYKPDMEIYYMSRDWNESSTWNSLGDGLAMGDDFDGLINRFAGDNEPNEYHIRHVDISEAVQRWADGELNYGLGIVSESIGGNDDGIKLFASEASQIMYRPAMEVEYTLVT